MNRAIRTALLLTLVGAVFGLGRSGAPATSATGIQLADTRGHGVVTVVGSVPDAVVVTVERVSVQRLTQLRVPVREALADALLATIAGALVCARWMSLSARTRSRIRGALRCTPGRGPPLPFLL